jgi:preprotein translocase subunit YajC
MDIFNGLFPLLAAGSSGAAGSGGGQMASMFVTFGLVFVVMYFLIIRPQSKRQKQAKAMLAALKKGDRVATIGGIRGIVYAIKDDAVIVKVDDNTKIEFSKSAVATVLNAAKPEAETQIPAAEIKQ